MGSTDAEEQNYQDEIKQLKQWWSDSRWRFTRRPYTAEQIASKRGNLKIEYASNAMSKKLWKLVEKRFAVSRALSVTWELG
jgi:isocitrate lyase